MRLLGQRQIRTYPPFPSETGQLFFGRCLGSIESSRGDRLGGWRTRCPLARICRQRASRQWSTPPCASLPCASQQQSSKYLRQSKTETNRVNGVIEVKHPLVDHHLTILRDKRTSPSHFRRQTHRLASLLAYAATADLPLATKRISTPLTEMDGSQLACRIALVPILRAGLGLVDPLQELLPDAEVWHLGMYRDEQTAEPVEYYCKLPTSGACDVAFILDPMLATGGSIVSAIEALQRWGCPDIRVLSVIASRPGVERMQAEYPQIRIYVSAIDPELNDQKFIVPGLGDAGDRIFNTEPS